MGYPTGVLSGWKVGKVYLFDFIGLSAGRS